MQVWDITLPDAAHASQWTEADPFAEQVGCNIRDTIRPASCYPGNNTHNSSTAKPCLQTSVVDAVYKNMFDHRINRWAWGQNWDFATGVGLTIANDTNSVQIDTKAFDVNFEKLLALGYRDLKFPVPACTYGGSCSIDSAGGINPNATCTVRVCRQNFALEDAIGSHAFSLEANMRATNAIPLGSTLSYQLAL
jgi:hypothetical protein